MSGRQTFPLEMAFEFYVSTWFFHSVDPNRPLTEPKPLWPVGGNLADLTSFFASSAVYRSGTMIPWAGLLLPSETWAVNFWRLDRSHSPPESRAPVRNKSVSQSREGVSQECPTLDHPAFVGCDPYQRAHSTGCDCCDSFMHSTVYTSIKSARISAATSPNGGPALAPIPSMFPCSVSTKIQSKPQRAIVLAWLLPGSICQAPKVRPEPVLSAFRSRFADCILTFRTFKGRILT